MGDLFGRVLAGEAAAARELDQRLREFARQICRGGGPPGAPAIDWEDVAQECGRKLLAGGLRRYSGAGSERAYLYSMVKVTVLEMSRTAARRHRRETESASSNPGSPKDPDASLDVRTLLAALDRDCREVVQRVVLQDESYGDVARDLGLAESSVRSRLSRCLERARRIAEGGSAS